MRLYENETILATGHAKAGPYKRYEMQVRAIAKDIGISPRKMRLVTNAVKGKSVNEALA